MENKEKKKKGLLIVYTGDGKGKTTAALGMTVRAIGHDWKISIIQFIKGTWKYGELEGIKRLSPHIEMETMGVGCIGIMGDKKPIEEHQTAGRKALDMANQKILSGKYNLIILDELNVAISLNLISREDTEAMIRNKPKELNLVVTGRNAPQWLIEIADLVTEMKEIKHPYQQGILAQKGIDF